MKWRTETVEKRGLRGHLLRHQKPQKSLCCLCVCVCVCAAGEFSMDTPEVGWIAHERPAEPTRKEYLEYSFLFFLSKRVSFILFFPFTSFILILFYSPPSFLLFCSCCCCIVSTNSHLFFILVVKKLGNSLISNRISIKRKIISHIDYFDFGNIWHYP